MKFTKRIGITSSKLKYLQQTKLKEKHCSSIRFLGSVNQYNVMEKFSSEDVFRNFATMQDVIASADLEFDAIELPEANPHAELCFNKVRRPSRVSATVWRNHWLFPNGNAVFYNYRIEIARHSILAFADERTWANTLSAESIHIVLDKILGFVEGQKANEKLDKSYLHSYLKKTTITGLSDFLEWHNGTGFGRSLLLEEEVN